MGRALLAYPRTGRRSTEPAQIHQGCVEGRQPSTLDAPTEPLIRVGDDFEDEYPGASALATECFANA